MFDLRCVCVCVLSTHRMVVVACCLYTATDAHRSLEHSTIIYERDDGTPLLRLTWNKQDPNYVATMMMDSKTIILLDVRCARRSLELRRGILLGCGARRVPSLPVAELSGHTACVNAAQWAPHSPCHLCTVADDNNALIWDVSALPEPIAGACVCVCVCACAHGIAGRGQPLDPILSYNAASEINNMAWCQTQVRGIGRAFVFSISILDAHVHRTNGLRLRSGRTSKCSRYRHDGVQAKRRYLCLYYKCVTRHLLVACPTAGARDPSRHARRRAASRALPSACCRPRHSFRALGISEYIAVILFVVLNKNDSDDTGFLN